MNNNWDGKLITTDSPSVDEDVVCVCVCVCVYVSVCLWVCLCVDEIKTVFMCILNYR